LHPPDPPTSRFGAKKMLKFYIAVDELNFFSVISEQAMLFSGWVFIAKIISTKRIAVAVKYRFLRLLGRMCAH